MKISTLIFVLFVLSFKQSISWATSDVLNSSDKLKVSWREVALTQPSADSVFVSVRVCAGAPTDNNHIIHCKELGHFEPLNLQGKSGPQPFKIGKSSGSFTGAQVNQGAAESAAKVKNPLLRLSLVMYSVGTAGKVASQKLAEAFVVFPALSFRPNNERHLIQEKVVLKAGALRTRLIVEIKRP